MSEKKKEQIEKGPLKIHVPSKYVFIALCYVLETDK